MAGVKAGCARLCRVAFWSAMCLQVDVIAGNQRVIGSPFTLSVQPFGPQSLRLVEAASTAVVGNSVVFRVSSFVHCRMSSSRLC